MYTFFNQNNKNPSIFTNHNNSLTAVLITPTPFQRHDTNATTKPSYFQFVLVSERAARPVARRDAAAARGAVERDARLVKVARNQPAPKLHHFGALQAVHRAHGALWRTIALRRRASRRSRAGKLKARRKAGVARVGERAAHLQRLLVVQVGAERHRDNELGRRHKENLLLVVVVLEAAIAHERS